jgi:hypothetical protein
VPKESRRLAPALLQRSISDCPEMLDSIRAPREGLGGVFSCRAWRGLVQLNVEPDENLATLGFAG